MLGGAGMTNVDGTEWYFPQRLTDDTGAVDQGNANPAQRVLGLRATMGHRLPRSLRIYAFGAYGGGEGSGPGPAPPGRWRPNRPPPAAVYPSSTATAPTPTTIQPRPIRATPSSPTSSGSW